jgi:hypothetical protein
MTQHMELEPWMENTVYPGRHWLLYSDTRAHHLVAEIYAPGPLHDGERFQWRVSRLVTHTAGGPGDDVGYAESLKDAQEAAVAFLRQNEARWEIKAPRRQLALF